jgi:formylmethanofuran dehydrogenase subunit E
MPDDQLLRAEWITLHQNIQQIMGSPRQRAYCIRCGEEVINGREVHDDGLPTCMACAGHAYYHSAEKVSIVKFRSEETYIP